MGVACAVLPEEAADFLSAVKQVRPTGIIGVSTIPKSFSKEVRAAHALREAMQGNNTD